MLGMVRYSSHVAADDLMNRKHAMASQTNNSLYASFAWPFCPPIDIIGDRAPGSRSGSAHAPRLRVPFAGAIISNVARMAGHARLSPSAKRKWAKARAPPIDEPLPTDDRFAVVNRPPPLGGSTSCRQRFVIVLLQWSVGLSLSFRGFRNVFRRRRAVRDIVRSLWI